MSPWFPRIKKDVRRGKREEKISMLRVLKSNKGERTVIKGKPSVFTHEEKLGKERIPVRSPDKWLNILMVH